MAGRIEVSTGRVAPPPEQEAAPDAGLAMGPADEQASPRPKRLLLTILKWVVSIVLIGWLLRNTNLGEITASIRSASLFWVAMAASLHGVGFLIGAYRWLLLLRAQGADAPILFLMRSYFISIFFSNFLPSTIGGDAVRIYDSWRVGGSRSGAVAIIFVDRFLGLLALMLFALVALPFARGFTEHIPYLNLWVVAGIGGMLGIVWSIFVPSRLLHWVGKIPFPFPTKVQHLLDAFLSFQGRRDVLLQQMVLSFLLQANVIVHYYFIGLALDLPIPFFAFFFIVPLVTLITMLPISINAIGVRENAFGFFFAAYGVTMSDSIAFAWIAFGLVLLQGVVGGILYALRK